MKKFINVIFIFISLSLFLVNCEDEHTEDIQDYFKSFKIEALSNPTKLSKDISGTIEGRKITLLLPESLDLGELIVSFEHQGDNVYVGEKLQTSGKTPNDFSKPLIYTVVTKSGARVDYTIEIIKVPDTENTFISFSFLKENNPFLAQDYIAVITGNKIEIEMPSVKKGLIATFETNASEVTINNVVQVNNVTVIDFSSPVIYTLVSEEGVKNSYNIIIKWTSPIPHFTITTENNADIVSKDDYIYADLMIEANGWGDDFTGKTRIRGRGNSTWVLPKKPFRLKLDEDAAILGLAEEKDWILLANFIDPTLMLNAVAFKIGELLELKYTNHVIPVDVTLNGKYIGNYMFTEQIERSKSRVNIHKKMGVLLELDINYDEDYQFISNNYGLPVMIKDPDLSDYDQAESDVLLQKIKDDFHKLESEIASSSFPNNNYKDLIDIESLVKYLIIYNLTQNMEINHPKSTYMYKDEQGKYFMGPIWDFDWGFDYEGTFRHFGSYNKPLFRNLSSASKGYTFFTRFIEDPEIKELYKVTWEKFRTEKMDSLLEYIDFYADKITNSQKKDYQTWKSAPNYPGVTTYSNKVLQLKSWLEGRAYYIDSYVKGF